MSSFTWIDMAIITVQFFQVFIAAFFLYNLLTPKYSFARCMGISTLMLGMGVCIGYIDFSNMLLREILQFFIIIVIGRSLYCDSWRRILFAYALIFALVIANDWLAALFIGTIFPEINGYPSGIRLLTGNLMFNISFMISVYFILVSWKRIRGEILPQSMYFAVLFPISQLFLEAFGTYDIVLQFSEGKRPIEPVLFAVLGSVFCVVADIILFQVIADNSQKERLAAQLVMVGQQTQLDYEYYNAVNENIEEIRRIRHDFNNQLQTAYSMVRGKEGEDDATQFLRELERRIEEAAPVCVCPNLIVNAVLREKLKGAKARGISFTTEVEIPEEIAIEKVDLCSIFSNLIDNAVCSAEECEKERWVTVKSYLRSGYCIVNVKNSCGMGGARYGRNTEKLSGHGYGLLILESIARKYHGEFTAGRERGVFSADIKLKLEQERGNLNEDTIV